MLKRASLAAAVAMATVLLIPAGAEAQMTMSLASAAGGGGVNAIIDGYHHTVEVAQTAAGAARARTSRAHQPFTVRKRVDAATPLLYRALANSETIPSVTLRIPTTRASGGPVMTITLTDARIVAIKSGKDDQDLPTEHVSFNFTKIKWASSEGTEFEDNWRENN